MKPNYQKIIEEAVEVGVRRGINRSYKYCDNPTELQLENQIVECVIQEIHEWFEFDNFKFD